MDVCGDSYEPQFRDFVVGESLTAATDTSGSAPVDLEADACGEGELLEGEWAAGRFFFLGCDITTSS